MYYLLYSSRSNDDMPKNDLFELLENSREYNLSHNITGMLLCINDRYHPDYVNGRFIQVLEGEMPDVKALYRKIEKDPRHSAVKLISEGIIMNRMFNDWKMGFRDLDILSFRNSLDLFELEETDFEQLGEGDDHLEQLLGFIKSFYKIPKDLKI